MKWRMREGAKMEGISEFDYTKQKVSHIPVVGREFGGVRQVMRVHM